MTVAERRNESSPAEGLTPFRFTAYVAGDEMAAAVEARVAELCAGRPVDMHVTVVDVKRDPSAAEAANVIALPTVVRESPTPRKRVIGQLDDYRRCAEALGLDVYPADPGRHS